MQALNMGGALFWNQGRIADHRQQGGTATCGQDVYNAFEAGGHRGSLTEWRGPAFPRCWHPLFCERAGSVSAGPLEMAQVGTIRLTAREI
ncbi:hypothetical protein BH23GEM6_BH23GEM6_26350 [soil metagenome]